LTFEGDLDRIKTNHRAKYLRHRHTTDCSIWTTKVVRSGYIYLYKLHHCWGYFRQ